MRKEFCSTNYLESRTVNFILSSHPKSWNFDYIKSKLGLCFCFFPSQTRDYRDIGDQEAPAEYFKIILII